MQGQAGAPAEPPSCHAMVVDGSVLEGGGQILRVSVALSAALGRPLHITRIRANRKPKPGLRPQHLAGIELVTRMCGGKLEGGAVGSSEVRLTNVGHVTCGKFVADPGTAGSVALLLQAAVPPACYARTSEPREVGGGGETSRVVEFEMKGGTNAEMAPQIDYITRVFAPMAARMGVRLDVEIVRRGYFPRGGGLVRARVTPLDSGAALQPIVLVDRGKLSSITGRSFVAGKVPRRVAEEMAAAAESALRKALGDALPLAIEVVAEDHRAAPIGDGAGIVLVGTTSTGCLLGGSALGRRGVPAKEVGEAAAAELLMGISAGGCVDEHLADQLVVFMALAAGRSTVRAGPLSLHTRTAIAIAEEHTGATFTVTPDEHGTFLITCDGIGHTRV